MRRQRPANERFKRPIHQAATRVSSQIKSLGSRYEAGRIGLLQVLDKAMSAAGVKPPEMRVLELGAGSGRLADFLIRKEHIRPSNYVLGDIVYGTHEAPALKRKVFSSAKKGRTKVRSLDIFEKPGNIGKFHLIAVSFVLGEPKWLTAMLDNYFERLAPGGIMVVGSAQYTNASIEHLTEKVARNPFMRMEQLTEQEKETMQFLNRLHALRESGQIEKYPNPTTFFHRTAIEEAPTMAFIIQKKR